MKEEWKPVKGYEGLYEVSNHGRVKSLSKKDKLGRTKTGKIKSQCNNGTGYLVVNLKHDGKQKMKSVHRLVAEVFVENPFGFSEVNHKDGNKQNNHMDNLEWCTHSENMKHAYENSLMCAPKGVDNTNHKLSKEDVEFIRKNAKPYDLKYGFEALARKFGCSATTIKYCVWGRTYVEFH